jgi:hypothetical protein
MSSCFWKLKLAKILEYRRHINLKEHTWCTYVENCCKMAQKEKIARIAQEL